MFSDLAPSALFLSCAACTVLQVVMVVTGHRNKSIANLFAVGGMSISLLAGLFYSMLAGSPTLSSALWGGVIAGGSGALIGTIVSRALGDVPPAIIAVGTVSSSLTGLLGGWLGRFL
jgi:hypothetical protein